jgi:hypothetical protein
LTTVGPTDGMCWASLPRVPSHNSSNTTQLGLADTCPQISRTTTTGTTGPALPSSLKAAFQLSSFGVNSRASVVTDITHEVLEVTLKQLERAQTSLSMAAEAGRGNKQY